MTTKNNERKKHLLNLVDYKEHAEKKLSKMVFGYYKSGADDEITLRDNHEDFKKIKLNFRVLRDVSKISTKTTLLNGTNHIDFPIMIAPTAMQKMAHVEGELGVSKAAKSRNTLMCLSTISTTKLEDVASIFKTSKNLWMQMYICKERKITIELLKRIKKTKAFTSLCVTVDTPILGNRELDHVNGFHLPEGLSLPNLPEIENKMNQQKNKSGSKSQLNDFATTHLDSSLNWKDLKWLRSQSNLPIILKGIVTYQDARLAVRHGVQGIIVSNHGGRQLDTGLSTIEALPQVVQGVKDELYECIKRSKPVNNVEVYLDGGVRRGTDVFKAIALGAKAVFLGRPILWGLSVDGQKGVEKVLDIIKGEFINTMTLCGCRSIDEIDESYIANLASHRYVHRSKF